MSIILLRQEASLMHHCNQNHQYAGILGRRSQHKQTKISIKTGFLCTCVIVGKTQSEN